MAVKGPMTYSFQVVIPEGGDMATVYVGTQKICLGPQSQRLAITDTERGSPIQMYPLMGGLRTSSGDTVVSNARPETPMSETEQLDEVVQIDGPLKAEKIVSIIWDTENLTPSQPGVKSQALFAVTALIKEIASFFDEDTIFQTYAVHPRSCKAEDRRAFEMAGFNAVDAGDKKGAVDTVMHQLVTKIVAEKRTQSASPSEHYVVLVTGDSDFTGDLRILREVPNVRTILIHRDEKVRSELLAAANITIPWSNVISRSIALAQMSLYDKCASVISAFLGSAKQNADRSVIFNMASEYTTSLEERKREMFPVSSTISGTGAGAYLRTPIKAEHKTPERRNSHLSTPPRGGHKTEICKHFQRGHCRLGKECGFLHPEGDESQYTYILDDGDSRPQRKSSNTTFTGAELSDMSGTEDGPDIIHTDFITRSFRRPAHPMYDADLTSAGEDALMQHNSNTIPRMDRRFAKKLNFT